MANKNKNKGNAAKPAAADKEVKKPAESTAETGSGDPSEEEGEEDNSDDIAGGEDAPENNLTDEQVEAQRALNERLDKVQAAFKGAAVSVYDDAGTPDNPIIAVEAEDESNIIEGQLSELEKLAEHVPTIIAGIENARFFDIGEELNDDGEIVVTVYDEDGGELAVGTLKNLVDKANEAAAAKPEPKPAKVTRGKTKTLEALETFKIRNLPFRPTNVLRVTKDFAFEGVDYKKGEVFDWYAQGLHRFKVKRLYAQRLLRHVVEDMGTIYPFKKEVKKVAKKSSIITGWDKLPESLKPKENKPAPSDQIGEYDSSEERDRRLRLLNRNKHGTSGSQDELEDNGTGNYGGSKKNFSIKGDLSGGGKKK